LSQDLFERNQNRCLPNIRHQDARLEFKGQVCQDLLQRNLNAFALWPLWRLLRLRLGYRILTRLRRGKPGRG
jgi:hypothetical protein